MDNQTVLCIDLDGTLLRTDMLQETMIQCLKVTPWIIFLMPLWLLRGKAHFKRQIAIRTIFDVANLPYNNEILSLMKEQYHHGRRLILVTASDMLIAQPVADHIGLFADVIASDGNNNLSGAEKLKVLVNRFGTNKFDYAGNAKADLQVWKHSRRAIIVNARSGVIRKAIKITKNHEIIDLRTNRSLMVYLKAIRIHQWAKNILIFVPLITSHQIVDIKISIIGLCAFFSFCFCSSSAYILNDILDLPDDRAHGIKKDRPFASGDLSIVTGLCLFFIFIAISLCISLVLPTAFRVVLITYFVTTCLYSMYVKQIVMMDVLFLAALYMLRIFAGSAATRIECSVWLFAFSMFMFLSLALVKRYAELSQLDKQDEIKARGRGYLSGDLSQIANMGTASGYIAILMLGLYINSDNIIILYKSPSLIWALCPLILYWISRIWLITHRGGMHEDPVVFAIKDKVSYIVAFLVLSVIVFASIL